MHPSPVRPWKGAPGRCLGVGWQVQLALGTHPGLAGGFGRLVAVCQEETGTGPELARSSVGAPLGLCLVVVLDTHCPLGAGRRGA